MYYLYTYVYLFVYLSIYLSISLYYIYICIYIRFHLIASSSGIPDLVRNNLRTLHRSYALEQRISTLSRFISRTGFGLTRLGNVRG